MALAAIKGDKTLADLAQQFDVDPNQITAWMNHLLGGRRRRVRDDKGSAEAPIELKALHAKIGELAL